MSCLGLLGHEAIHLFCLPLAIRKTLHCYLPILEGMLRRVAERSSTISNLITTYNPANTKHLYNLCTTSAQSLLGPTLYNCYTNMLSLLGGKSHPHCQKAKANSSIRLL